MLSVIAGLQIPTARAQTTDKSSILLAINRVRLASGLTPLAVNPALEKAAQLHSDDMASHGFVDHTGTNGSNPVDRISAAGYPAWQDTRVWAENVYAGSHGFTEALDYFLRDEIQRRNFLAPRYREVGIGVGGYANANGEQMIYWTLDFGSQPNVLPIFINDGVTLINVPQVAIHLSQEEAVPGGEGAAVGSIIEARISSDPSFKDVAWQKWEPLIPFAFDARPGLKSVYVQMRDGGGRVTASTASVQYDPSSTPQVESLGPGFQISPEISIETPADNTPTPFQTIVPVQTVQPGSTVSTLQEATAAPTSNEVVVIPQISTEVSGTPSPQPTALTHGIRNESGAALPNTLLTIYLIVQTFVILAGIYGFFRMKNPSVNAFDSTRQHSDPGPNTSISGEGRG
ncbi:MAG: CAP domain-containing protein [Chloroflexi bacterium]|nr:CAP domain-containing protein [Chloroflexota bacterium]MCL5274180.1 CAP domain-containing protein [Chloroflexota bacterium]